MSLVITSPVKVEPLRKVVCPACEESFYFRACTNIGRRTHFGSVACVLCGHVSNVKSFKRMKK